MPKKALATAVSFVLILISFAMYAHCEPAQGDAPAAQAYLDAATKAMYEDRDYAEALRLAQTALKLDPDNIQALATIAGVYSMTDMPSEASKTYLKLFELSGGKGCNWLSNASYYAVNAGEFENGAAFMESYTTRYPEDTCALYSLVGYYNADGRFEDALVICDKLIGLDPENYRYHNKKAEALEGLKRPEDSLESYKTAAKLSGYNYGDMYGAIYNLVRLERYDEAIGLLDASINAHPDVPAPYRQKGEILITLGKTEEAESVMLEGLDKAPDYGLVFALAGIAVLDSDYDKALGYLDTEDVEGLKHASEYGILADLLRVVILAHTGNSNEALASLDAIALPADMRDDAKGGELLDVAKLAGKMLIYYAKGNYLQAEVMLDKLSENETLSQEGVREVIDLLRVYVLTGLEEYDEALALLKDSGDEGGLPETLRALVLIKRGGKGDAEKAHDILEGLLPVEKNPKPNIELAIVYALQGSKEEMLEQLQGLIVDEPLSKLLILHMPEFGPYLDDPDFIEAIGR